MSTKLAFFVALLILPLAAFSKTNHAISNSKICKTDNAQCSYRCTAREYASCQLIAGNCESALTIGTEHAMGIEDMTWAPTNKAPRGDLYEMLFCKDSWIPAKKIKEKPAKIVNPGCGGVDQTLGFCSPYYPEF